MPPRKRAAAKAKAVSSPPPLPLAGFKIALCGTFPGIPQSTAKESIEKLGAEALGGVTADATHLISCSANYNRPTQKCKAAEALGIPIVSIKWLQDCLASNSRKDEAPYYLGPPVTVTLPSHPATSAPSPPSPATHRTSTDGTKKRNAPSSAIDQTTASASAIQPDAKRQKADDKASSTSFKDVKTVKGAEDISIVVPIDEFCPVTNVVVFIDDDGTVFDASLNQTNSGANSNKFYRLQLLCTGNGKTREYKTWTRWGRVGERGQSAMLDSGSLDDALKTFRKKFRDKSGLAWEDRTAAPKVGKYAYVERSYEPDSENESDASTGDGGKLNHDADDHGQERPAPKSTLPRPVQKLMELIFNPGFFAATMSDLNYDADKLPLGKLSKATISRGFQTLKDLSTLINDPGVAQTLYNLDYPRAVEQLSNLYYSVIPHAFGRLRPPILTDFARIKKEIELLESLGDMKDAELLMKVGRAESDELNSIDRQFQGLGMEEVTPLDHSSTEFTELASYLTATRGTTHKVDYKIDDIFRIERKGEQSRFNSCTLGGGDADTRLLWHGSRVTNFGGILGQGLRIAPPEAPVSGYMFGKGIYLADMSSKSANYCCSYISGGTALLLLCEAKLGSPLQKLTSASYNAGADAKKNGMYSTLGQGTTGPSVWKDAGVVHKDLAGVKMPDVSTAPGPVQIDGAQLLYNEYIVYDVSQVRLRYLFRVRL